MAVAAQAFLPYGFAISEDMVVPLSSEAKGAVASTLVVAHQAPFAFAPAVSVRPQSLTVAAPSGTGAGLETPLAVRALRRLVGSASRRSWPTPRCSLWNRRFRPLLTSARGARCHRPPRPPARRRRRSPIPCPRPLSRKRSLRRWRVPAPVPPCRTRVPRRRSAIPPSPSTARVASTRSRAARCPR